MAQGSPMTGLQLAPSMSPASAPGGAMQPPSDGGDSGGSQPGPPSAAAPDVAAEPLGGSPDAEMPVSVQPAANGHPSAAQSPSTVPQRVLTAEK
jgi:hypothetical protein